ncbi:MAG: peptidase domain-containing ABC transporter [Oscillospiraceae bacterium]|jgi:ATP-binding cassette subfamily B protein|nr:peptidase domain-containing ABC transporter [Oscillospiraceae bacterium]
MPRYTCIKQFDITDCGAACLATIAKQYGLKIPITRIREVAGTDKRGTNAYGVIKAAEQLGFSAKGVKGDKEAFFTPFPLPCIAHVVVGGSLLHYVVIHKISRKQIIIADPAKGIRKVAPEEFFKEWSGVLILMAPTQRFEKGDHSKSIWSRFFHLLIPQRSLMLNIFFASLVYTVLGIGASFYFKVMMDEVLPNLLERTLTIVSIGVIALYLFRILLGAFRSHMLLYMSQKLDINLILGYYSHVLELPMSFFGTRKVGEIVTRFMDASKVREAISGATLTIMIDTLMAVIGGVILYMQNSAMFFVAAIVAALYGVIVFSFNKPLQKINRKSMEENAQLTSFLVESLNGIETVKAFNSERSANIETEKKFVRLQRALFHNGVLNNFSGSLSGFISAVGGVVILWVGAHFVINGTLTIGQLLTFNALLVYFLDPVKNLINLQPMMQTAIVASDRLGEILDLELEKTEGDERKMRPASLHAPILIKGLDFRYGTRQLVLQDINLSIRSGEKIALVGESGSGKTTLVKLLLNFYPWEKGDIQIGPYNIKDINLEWLREKIAYISQDVFLFSGTIFENLTLGLPDPAMEEVVRVAEMTCAHDFINSFPLRYETLLEENGANLSGGQKQRLAITRALLKKPDILIMDEATSNLDSITEKAISRMIDEQTSGITSIIIAHRLSTIMRCDRIFIMDNGRFVESGSHAELMAMQGRYYRLWKEQTPESLEGVQI